MNQALKIGTGKHPFSLVSAWSCKTGKRNYKSHHFLNEWIYTLTKKDQPSSKFQVKKKKRKTNL